MRLWRAILRLFRPRSAYERLAHEWIQYEHKWRRMYTQASPTERRRLVDLLQAQRASFHSRKLEIEQDPCAEYKPILLQVPEAVTQHRTVGDILKEKGYDKSH